MGMTAEEKFNSCIHRSVEAQEITIVRCACAGGNYTQFSHICYRLNINDIQPPICEDCPMFEKRKEVVSE